jgi:hypothetical protein
MYSKVASMMMDNISQSILGRVRRYYHWWKFSVKLGTKVGQNRDKKNSA